MEEIIAGALYLVATPIGNLGDISFRAIDILKRVDLIAAEDTRTSAVLLRHYNIKTALRSYHSYNLRSETPRLIAKLNEGSSIALISDAGTPGISDPGYQLVQACVTENIRIIPVPGASALLAALTASGLPVNRFVFEGFLPLKKGRKTKLAELAEETRTIVLFESTHRLQKTVRELAETMGDRPCAIARELTKKFETFYHGTLPALNSLVDQEKLKGEIVLIIAGANVRMNKKKGKNE